MSNTVTVGAALEGECPPPTTTTTTSRVDLGPVTWLPWAVSHPLATASRERGFVADLAAFCIMTPAEHTRSDITACLNALRGGLSLAELAKNAPGLRPSRLYGAYVALEELRREAVAAWTAIVEEPSVQSLHRYGGLAARVVPVLIDRLHRSVVIDPNSLQRVIEAAAADVDAVRRMIESTERRLDDCADDDVAVALSQTLYNPVADCVFARPDHLPARVGSLMPSQVAALLGERSVVPMGSAASR